MGKGDHAFAVDALSLVNGEFNANSTKERNEIASDLIKKIEDINAYLTTQKPSEVEWVKKEEEAINKTNKITISGRVDDLIYSLAYNHYTFKKLFFKIAF